MSEVTVVNDYGRICGPGERPYYLTVIADIGVMGMPDGQHEQGMPAEVARIYVNEPGWSLRETAKGLAEAAGRLLVLARVQDESGRWDEDGQAGICGQCHADYTVTGGGEDVLCPGCNKALMLRVLHVRLNKAAGGCEIVGCTNLTAREGGRECADHEVPF